MSIYGPHQDEYTDFLEKSFLAGKFVTSTGYGASLSLSLPVVKHRKSFIPCRRTTRTVCLVRAVPAESAQKTGESHEVPLGIHHNSPLP